MIKPAVLVSNLISRGEKNGGPYKLRMLLTQKDYVTWANIFDIFFVGKIAYDKRFERNSKEDAYVTSFKCKRGSAIIC
jgi:hypothetical protein